jgi:hypothetical protein
MIDKGYSLYSNGEIYTAVSYCHLERLETIESVNAARTSIVIVSIFILGAISMNSSTFAFKVI